jgi:aralkylamine N-acetyltransferase
VHARLVKTGALVGFARATSDRALNATVWDLVTDPMLRDRAVMARNVISYLLREIRRTVPTCSIALISDADDVKFFSSMDFVASPDGITSMVLSPDYSVEPNGP